jgi:hypothetical protein
MLAGSSWKKIMVANESSHPTEVTRRRRCIKYLHTYLGTAVGKA